VGFGTRVGVRAMRAPKGIDPCLAILNDVPDLQRRSNLMAIAAIFAALKFRCGSY
jgi:hypothetical protein